LRSPPRCRSTSATREVPGSAAATKTPTAWSASTSQEEPTSRASPKRISMRLPCDSINVRERPWASKPQPINYKGCRADGLNSQRLLGAIRRERLDHMVVLGEDRLHRMLADYASYYNGFRTHLSLGKDAPTRRPVQRVGQLVTRPILGGPHQAGRS